MGCSKPDHIPCPRAGTTAPFCIACRYHYLTIRDENCTSMSYFSPVAKTIDQFTTDELLAEIRRRMK